MRAVIQRVKEATVSVDGIELGSIDHGLLVYLGVSPTDTEAEVAWVTQKIAKLRIFNDEAGKMNKSVTDIDGGVMIISQFTLYGDLRKGNRPSFNGAGDPALAESLYEACISEMKTLVPRVASGSFGAYMQVQYTNDGPVTLVLEYPEAE
ncbi:MAG TPA: D-aminoacyl-tRNA deacylase [Sphaerochaeta sp.]|nr:D-aminoacyl-tRNA deacylase [Sphaerochaeta sp.]